MLIIDTSPVLYTRKEIWFCDEQEPSALAQNSLYLQSQVLPGNQQRYSTFQTLVSDLAQSDEQLLALMSKSTKRYVKAAQNEGFEFLQLDVTDAGAVAGFFASKTAWEAGQQRTSGDHRRLQRLMDAGHLRVYGIRLDGRDVVYHSYLHTPERARLLTSHDDVHFDNPKLTALANKLLHFRSMQAFRDQGLKVYDWGGISETRTPGITRFKRSFGGAQELSYNFTLTGAGTGYTTDCGGASAGLQSNVEHCCFSPAARF